MERTELKYVPMYKSYIDAVAKLTPEDRLVIYEAIFNYGFTGEEPTFDNPYLEMGWNLVKPNLDNNIKNNLKNNANGSKGGRPKSKPSTEEPKSTEQEPKPIEQEPKPTQSTDFQKKLFKLVENRNLNEYDKERFQKQITQGDFDTIDELTEALNCII